MKAGSSFQGHRLWTEKGGVDHSLSLLMNFHSFGRSYFTSHGKDAIQYSNVKKIVVDMKPRSKRYLEVSYLAHEM